MGTNYYAKPEVLSRMAQEYKAVDIRPFIKEVHLGKSSGGWKFTLQYNNGDFYTDWGSMKKWLEGMTIENEYGTEVSLKDFVKLVDSKQQITDPEDIEEMVDIGGYKRL